MKKVSFRIHAGVARSSIVRHPLRVGALRRAVTIYCPLGFTATWNYLVSHAGPVDEDGPALVRALDILETSRMAWLAEMAEYAARRRMEKRRNRAPDIGEYRYLTGFRWPGPDGPAATRHAVESLWTPDLAELDRKTTDYVSAYLDGRPLEDVAALLPDPRPETYKIVQLIANDIRTSAVTANLAVS
ncbi:hypothetical protein [Herbidospora yilanensis]|uniref:hypothetical protein n=1 Tax=Herbidospora yilanensis TaxID=354426 RepID=UPI000782755B|nr:hypothetical protein [Herbidospora yilanensis]